MQYKNSNKFYNKPAIENENYITMTSAVWVMAENTIMDTCTLQHIAIC